MICDRTVSIFGRSVSICSRSEKYFQEVGKMFDHLVALNVQNWVGSPFIYQNGNPTQGNIWQLKN